MCSNPYLIVTQETGIQFRKLVSLDIDEFELVKPNPFYGNPGETNIWCQTGRKYSSRQLSSLLQQNRYKLIRGDEEEREHLGLLEMVRESVQAHRQPSTL